MRQDIKQRIKRINLGEVPEGYKKTKVGIVPSEWEVKKVGDFAPLQRGFDLPNYDIEFGNFPVCYSNGISNYHSKYMVTGPGVFTGRSGTIGNVFYVENDFWPHNTSLWVTKFENTFPKYIYYFFDFLNLKKYDAGTGVPTLNRNDVHIQKSPLPPLPEQKKIADILSTWDKAIGLKEQYIQTLEIRKKALIQKLFTGTVHLLGFSDKWEKHRLKSLVVEVNNRNKDISIDKVYSISNKSGLIPQNEQFDKIIASKDISNYKIISKGCIAYNPSRINVGSIASSNLNFNVIVSPMYIVIMCNQKLLLTDFMIQWINSHSFDQQMRTQLSGSVRDSLNFSDLGLIKIKLPSTKEQKSIIQVLSLADLELSIQKAELETIKLQKKGLMQVLLTGKVRVN